MRRRNLAIALTLVIAIAIVLMWYSLEPPASVVPETVTDIPQTAVPPKPPTIEPPETIAETQPTSESEQPPPPESFSGTIQGSVSDADTELPINSFEILAAPGEFLRFDPQRHVGFETIESPDGLFFLNNLTRDGLTLFVRADGYQPAFQYVSGLRSDLAITDIDFQLNPYALLTVVVTTPTGQPVPNATVHATDPYNINYDMDHPTQTTDEHGVAKFDDVLPGTTPLTVFLKDVYEESSAFVYKGQETVARVIFDGNDTFEGRIVYAGPLRSPILVHFLKFVTVRMANPPPNLPEELAISREAHRDETVACDAEGYFTTENVPSGDVSFGIQLPINPNLELRSTIRQHNRTDPILIHVPAFDTGAKIKLDLPDVAGSFTTLGGHMRVNEKLRFSLTRNAANGDVIEFGRIPLAPFQITISMGAIHPEFNKPITLGSAQFDLSEFLTPGAYFDGTLHITFPENGSDQFDIAVSGDYRAIEE